MEHDADTVRLQPGQGRQTVRVRQVHPSIQADRHDPGLLEPPGQ